MDIKRQDLGKSQVEISVELSVEEFAPYIEKGAQKVSETVKIEGFRPGKVPLEMVKQKVGEMSILEEAAHIVIRKNIDKIIDDELKDAQVIGQPSVEVIKLAPNNPMAFKVKLITLPPTTLGKYKELGVKEDEIKIDDKEVAKNLTELAGMRAKEIISENEIKEGDKVIVSIEMFLDNVPIENGQIPEVTILIGKEYFVPGFDKKMIGAKKDAVLEFGLPYPDDHHQANLAGKMVDFKVKVKEVYNREVPELNDELAVGFGFKKVAEIEEFIKNNLSAQAKEKVEQKAEIEMLDKLVSSTTFGEIPEILVKNESELMLNELQQGITQQGGKFEDYLASIKKSKEELVLDFLPQAVKRVKSALILREVALKEGLAITKEEIEEKINEIKKQYKSDEKVQKMADEPGYRSYIGNILANQKVIKKLREWNINK
jgi:trigger factor